MSRRGSFRQALNRAVTERRLLVVPGAYDALSALLIERTGFDTMFIGGFPVAGARYGVPDIGLKGFADIAAAVRDIIAACDVPVLVDIDDGYGDVKNAVHTVQTYERIGASAVFLEDQAWPKRCGHMAGKKVVPAEIMEAKIRATMAERLGFNAICFGLETIMHAAKAMKIVLEDMRAGTFALRDQGMGFEEFKALV